VVKIIMFQIKDGTREDVERVSKILQDQKIKGYKFVVFTDFIKPISKEDLISQLKYAIRRLENDNL